MHALLLLPRRDSSFHRLRVGFLAVAILGEPLLATAPAATLTWDGNSTWDAGATASWYNGSADQTWTAGATAAFGASGSKTVTVSGSVTVGGLSFNQGGYTLQGGTVTLNTGTTISTNGGTTTFSGTLSLASNGAVAITKTGSGILSLATNNTATLGTGTNLATWTISGGTYSGGTFDSVLSVTLGNNLGAAPTNAATQVTLDAGTLQIRAAGSPAVGGTRTFQVNPGGGAVADISGGANTYQNNVVNNAAANSSLYLSNTGGVATFSGVISGGGSLTWNGSGTLSLTNANPYTGATVVNAGVLSLPTGGSINSSTTVSGTAGALTLSNAAALSDAGTLTLVSGTTLNLSAANGTSERIAQLVLNGVTEPAGTYTAAQLAALSGASGITFSSASGETLTIAPVPEPATWVAGGLVALAAVRRLRCRRSMLRFA